MRALTAVPRLAFVLAALAGSAGQALAHPHVWVTTRAELVYAPDGTLAAIRHAWTFDEGYSAYAVEGMLADGKLDPVKAQELARTNTDSLAESDYFTVLRAGGAKQAFEAPRDADIRLESGRLTLRFTLPLAKPPTATRLLLDVYDPTFFVDFTIADGADAVTLSGAPASCAVTIQRPKPETSASQAPLSEAFFQALTSASTVGAGFANRAVVQCR